MDLTNIAKDAIRIASTAGLSKDVIDLLTAKITLLDEKLVETKAAFSDVMLENQKLRKQLDDMQPVENGLNEEETKILHFFFEATEASCPAASANLQMPLPEVIHHVNSLIKREFLRHRRGSAGPSRPSTFCITHEGSSQIMKKG